jgi:transposase
MLQLYNIQEKTRKRRTTPEERARILLSLQKGHSTREIARVQRINASTVSRIKQRWLQKSSLEDAVRSGRPPTVNKPIQRKIVNLITSRRCSSAVEVQKCLQKKENINISTPTIRRILRDNGLVSRVKKKNLI